MFELIFFTSNRVKTQHAKHLCRDYDIEIVNFNEVTKLANYNEPRIDDRTKLLQASFESAKSQLDLSGYGKNRAFIIEDTSVDIKSLSHHHGKEFPGVEIKYWMKSIDFIDLDYSLQMFGNDREVTVRSDLILYIPTLDPNKYHFIGKSHGIVTNNDDHFDTNVVYPWLDNKTFNKWFQPEGEPVVISKLPIEKADLYDFRARAFVQMLSMLHKQGVIKKKYQGKIPHIEELFELDFECHLVFGLTCAGKTTTANYLINETDFLHIEASDFMHEIYREHHGIDSGVEIGKFAKELLKKQPMIVAERVLRYLNDFKIQHTVITGFRLEEEASYIENNLSNSHKVKRVIIEASRSIRESRKANRKRDGDITSTECLISRDKRELEMGMEALISHESNISIQNEGTFETLYQIYGKSLHLSAPVNHNKIKNTDPNRLKLKQLIVIALYGMRHNEEKADYYSTTDICVMVNALGLNKPKFVNNVGRFFSKRIGAMFEVELFGTGRKIRRYRLSNTGAGYAKTLLRDFQYSK
ncbi:MAG: inosine/xanthosine triphosphate pyrophosphatase family protein/dephospho-CoA kinase [Psychroserpens sp.]